MRRIDRLRPKNPSEAAFYDWAIAQGWKITRRGWPDFFCWDNHGHIRLVEVKRTAHHKLRNDQERILCLLAALGIPCFKWSPPDHCRRIKPTSTDQDP